MKPTLFCPNCKKDVSFIQKLDCRICENCRVILEYKTAEKVASNCHVSSKLGGAK